MRVRIVAAGSGQAGPARRFIVGSLAVHVAIAAAFVLAPGLRRGSRIPPDATVVELVGALPGSRTAPAAQTLVPVPQSAPEPPPPQPEGVTLQQPKPPDPEPKPKPPEKKPEKKKEEKKPEPKPAGTTSTAPAVDSRSAPPESPAAAPGASGHVAGSAAAGGSVSAIELGDAAFAWYRAAVANRLYGSWRRPMVSGLREPIEVRVAFEIMRDGTLRGLRVEESSGVPVLDRSALRAVGDASPLPPLPSSLREPYLPAGIVFRLFPEGTQAP